MSSYRPLPSEEERLVGSTDDDIENGTTGQGLRVGGPPRSHYQLTRPEITKNLANRFVHSRTYVFLYLGMAALSATTVGLSLAEGCPGLAFFVLEWIINGAMILEVGIRFVAFGKQFWKSPFNTIDLGLTCLCIVTLLVITFAGCGATSKEEELLDTLLLVARNVLQFGRLAAVMRKSGQSIFSRPKPIDLNAIARRAGRMDIDLDDDEEYDGANATRNAWFPGQHAEQGPDNDGEEVLFDATAGEWGRDQEGAWNT